MMTIAISAVLSIHEPFPNEQKNVWPPSRSLNVVCTIIVNGPSAAMLPQLLLQSLCQCQFRPEQNSILNKQSLKQKKSIGR